MRDRITFTTDQLIFILENAEEADMVVTDNPLYYTDSIGQLLSRKCHTMQLPHMSVGLDILEELLTWRISNER